ncbi:aminotransferase class I/II-fold pyridoxal phosphate-dependent enzyme [Gordonia sp. DT30]
MSIDDPTADAAPQRIVIDDPSPAGIAGAIGRMIRAGELVPGDRLPTVRHLAAQLGVSPATVSHGWKALARSGLVISRGRSGTFVAARAGVDVARASRTATMARTHGSIGLDLSKGSPDPELLPELAAALANVAKRAATTSYHDHPVVPELGELLRTRWPSKAQALTVVDGALDAVARSLQAVTTYGDRVIVEDPTFPQFLDLLEGLGLQHVAVPIDPHGPDPAAFAQAVSQ